MLEARYTEECLLTWYFWPQSATLFRRYIEYIADSRLERIGLPTRYFHSANPLTG